MKFAALIPLFGCICNLFLAVFVFARNTRSPANRVYFFLGLAIANWNLGSFLLFVVGDAPTALFWARELHFGLCFGIVLFFHLSLIIAQIPVKRWICLFYGAQTLIALTVFTPYFIPAVRDLGTSGWYSVAGPVYHFFAGSFSLAFLSIFLLVRKRMQVRKLHRRGLDTMIFAQSMLALLGNNDILPILGVDKYPFTNIQVYPYGSLAANFYGIMVAYSVLQYQLLDVHLVVGKVVAHCIRFGFMFFIGLAMLMAVTIFEPGQFTTTSFISALAVLLASGVIASVLFPRLFGSGAEALERRIVGDRFEYHDHIRAFIASMQWYDEADRLLVDLHDLLLKIIGVTSYQIILLDDASRVFSLFRSYPEQAARPIPEFTNDSPIFRYFIAGENEYLAFNLAYATTGDAGLENEARKQLQEFEAEFCFPFFFEDEPFGLLLIGGKKSGEPYTSTDLDLLVSLSKNLSVMINQIRLKNQILQAQEMELLGRMSRGMAHDLNNLLTPVWTFLQLSSEGVSAEDLNEDLLPVALRNIKTMRAYIREALFFSQNLRPDFQLGRLDVVISQAVDLVRSKEEKSVDILISTPGEVLVEMDEVMIQRLIANVVSNAVDASQPGATIHIELLLQAKADLQRDWLRVRVADSGEGIRPEDLGKVFTPYFTTKNRGDDKRGFGLGLAICRKIVHLHGGNLNISSQVKKGTTVQIDLPSRQVKSQISIPTLK